VTLTAVTVGALLAAVLLARLWKGRGWMLLAIAVLAVPIFWSLPQTVRRERTLIGHDLRLTPLQAELEPPRLWPGYANLPLLRAMRRLIPKHDTVTFLPGRRLAPGKTGAQLRRDYLQTGWVRWVAFVLAPRLVVDSERADWVVLAHQTPYQAHLRGHRRWRFGQDWLVEL
jgi:hypothetical protein